MMHRLEGATKRFLVWVIFVTVCAGCQMHAPRVKPALVEEGEVFLYLEPFSADARALRFSLDKVAAVRSDGVETPLTLNIAEVKGTESDRQRLLASGVLPPGSYQGFSVTARKAFLTAEGGEVPLVVSDTAVKVPVSFEVRRKQGTVFSLNLPFKESVRARASFRPALVAMIPPLPVISLTGYVTNAGSNTITVFDKREGAVRRVIVTGQEPKGLALDQGRLKAYVAISGEDAVDVIDTRSHEIINRIRLTYSDRPGEIALTPDGKTLLTVNTGTNTVSFVDTDALLEVARVSIGTVPRSILLDPTGSRAYIFNYLSSNIKVIDIARRTVVATITTDAGPLRGRFNHQGDKLLVVHELSPYFLVLDPATGAVLNKVYIGFGSSSIGVDTLTNLIYLGRKSDPIVEIYSPFSLIPADFLKGAGGPWYMLFDGEMNSILLVLPDQKALQSINLISKRPNFAVDLGDQPFWATIMGER